MTILTLALAAALAGDPDTVKVTLDYQNAPLHEILNHLTLISEVPIELDDAAKKKLGDPAQVLISIKLKDISVTSAVKLILGPRGLEVKVVDRKKLLVTPAG